MSSVVILGAGPAGMMAALAVERNGHTPIIFTKELKPSPINEDMFLQKPLPDVHGEPDVMIEYMTRGTEEGYAARVYGSPTLPTSWQKLKLGRQPGWWLSYAYQALWERYEGHISQLNLGPAQASILAENYPLVISTLPGPALCARSYHAFLDRHTYLVRHRRHDDRRNSQEIVYNGEEGGPQWFRMSKLGPWATWEYAAPPPVEEVTDSPLILSGRKLIGNNCNCLPKVHRIGRWAMWQRGVLNHHAFEQATSILATVGLGKGVAA